MSFHHFGRVLSWARRRSTGMCRASEYLFFAKNLLEQNDQPQEFGLRQRIALPLSLSITRQRVCAEGGGAIPLLSHLDTVRYVLPPDEIIVRVGTTLLQV